MISPGHQDQFFQVEPDDPRDRRSDREVVLLLHGLGGNKDDWRFPEWREAHWDVAHDPPNRHDDNHLRPPLSPLELLPEFGLSELRSDSDVRCWSGVLKALGHTVINYNQDGNQDTVDVPLAQFEQRIVPLIRNEVLTGQLAGKRVVLLCHSRGGILARAYLHRHPQEGSEWIGRLITLCSPHQGTHAPGSRQRLADEALGFGALGVLAPVGLLATALAQIFIGFDESEGANQLLPDNPIFAELASPEELRNMNIEVRTFGGTSVRAFRVYNWFYTPGSYLPNWSDFPDLRFDWTQFPVEVLPKPMLDVVPDDLVDHEQREGEGDILVTDARARLPGVPHESFPVNHAEALWDENLFARVAELLGTPLSDAGPVECGHRATFLTIEPAGVNFGVVAIGETVSRTVGIRNDTGRPVAVQVPPAPPGVFEWTAIDEVLPNGEETAIEFVFHSVDISLHTERVRVTSTAPDSPQDIGLVGKGPGGFPFPPEEPLPTRLFFSSTRLDFGSTAVGTTESQHLDIRNETGRSVRITIDPPHPESVFQWQAVDASLATGTKRRVTVKFTPKSTAVMRGMLLVTSATASSPESIRMIGRGPGHQDEPTGDPDRPDVHPR
jgi:pimeloyl-ACP methyl ester carboxylesterase